MIAVLCRSTLQELVLFSKDMKAIIAKNKKAYFDYEVMQEYEAGIVLMGPEIKSIRQGSVNLKGNFVHEWKGSLWVEGMHIGRYAYATTLDLDPKRKRQLLLRKKEIQEIAAKIQQKGISATVLALYLKGNLVKVTLGIVRGKKKYDKRESMKKKDEQRKIQSAIKIHMSR